MDAVRSGLGQSGAITSAPDQGAVAAIAAILVAGAGWVHVLAIQDHWAHPHVAAFFGAVSVAQLGWALRMASSTTPPLLWMGLVGNAGLLLVWGISRTSGLGFVPDAGEREPVGSADLAASSLELVAMLGLFLIVAKRTLELRAETARLVVAASALLTVALVLVAGAETSSHHDGQDHHDEPLGVQSATGTEYARAHHASR